VCSANNVQLVSRTRIEHLSDQDKRRSHKSSVTPLQSFLKVAEQGSRTRGANAAARAVSKYYVHLLNGFLERLLFVENICYGSYKLIYGHRNKWLLLVLEHPKFPQYLSFMNIPFTFSDIHE